MVRMADRQQLNNRQTTTHSHKPTVRGMDMVRTHMPIIKHKLHPLLITRDNKDINLTHDDNFIILVTLDTPHCIVITIVYWSCDQVRPLQMRV